MSEKAILVQVDPRAASNGVVDWFPREGEFAAAWRAARAVDARIPFAVVLELYDYEVLERAREHVARGDERAARVPFWPPALYLAGDVEGHAGEALAAERPALRVACVVPTADEVAAAARELFGVLPFDPSAYVTELARVARESEEGLR